MSLWKYLPVVLVTAIVCSGAGGQSLVRNGGFEEVDNGAAVRWSSLWTRDEGVGKLFIDSLAPHSGGNALRIEHAGDRDWSESYSRRVAVKAGDVLELSCWVKVTGGGNVTPCVAAYDADSQAVDWTLGGRTETDAPQWTLVRSKFVIGDNVVSIVPRVIGYGAATVWIDDYELLRTGNVGDMRNGSLPEVISIANDQVEASLSTVDGTLSVIDQRSGRAWEQKGSGQGVVVLDASLADRVITARLLDTNNYLQLTVSCHIERDRELVVTLVGDGPLDRAIGWPYPFVSDAGDRLIVPMNEGIGYPADDESIGPMRLIGYGGHGICMSFWGVDAERGGYMAIIETPDDMRINMDRLDERLCIGPEWEAQKGQFGYERQLRYVFFDEGDHVEMCKRYRRCVQERGTFKTMAQKRQDNPNVDLLIGAVNVWCWDKDAVAIVRQLQAAGIERVLWSHRRSPEVIEAMNAMKGVLTSRYDIYQDLMDPEVVETQLEWVHPDWTQDGWPDDLMIDSRGRPIDGWKVRGKDGNMYPCGVLCDRQAVKHAQQRVPAELATHPYRCRFIDTTTASSWRECYDKDHPLTRSESRQWKMRLLEYMSKDAKLVTGSETGHDAAVPYVHYFEGMLSLGPYRVPDAGRDMRRIWEEVPERVAKFQVGQKYRLPLWELVYHDCVVAQWYWGDYNNKLPAIWDKRDLFNVLYATPPMFMFDRKSLSDNIDRFAESYKSVCPLVRSVGYSEMIDHRILDADRSVQQTEFANGTIVTVNFTDTPFELPDGRTVAAMGHLIDD